ncbi:MAG: protein tyrosine phosphatase family protein [Sulfurospirillaceae bacterium]|nr:protein tyrosine phosphatase family protein [Sulfurospirillaceae bacterium]
MTNILNYIKINENISTSGQPSTEQFRTIHDAGFEIVINLALCSSENAIANEDKIVTENNMIYIHIPISWENPEIEKLKFFIRTLAMLQQENKKVFVHCAKNYRASIFLYHYKKTILNEKHCKLILPKGFIPNSVWNEIINMNIV